ncbi:lysylphosphatidylglycerol synthase transmembrane domain-containing protein [Janibacter sp. DB-40]|uniref:lysylphosphatidylglycerol synthase transmembrane domain-containing protein n=1 Tax=Janibacter sp. DB-40 TaxID=3028808 RepID=UPI002406AFFE|nr:lysylphosphatidylglycerol synthase transmembrane domain-containing protein [Janibacter sp. DB-40]
MGRAPPESHWLPWLRPTIGAAILAVLLWQVGAAPFVTALTEVTWWSLLAALVITVLTTVCAAWRWSTVATGLGVRIGLPAAVAAYYRSQFLNSVLPGGVLGDVHRAVRHGHDVHRMGRGVRSVVWERVLGQVVQVVLTVVLLLVLPSPVHALVAIAVVGLVAVGLGFALVRVSGVLLDDLRRILRVAGAPVGIALTSGLAVLGHVTVFLVAMSASGVEVSFGRQVALALIVLLGAAIPTSLAGWGPREGVAAWAFEAAGLGAAAGVSVAVLYGVLALVATLPGALLLVGGGSLAGDGGSRRSLSSCEGRTPFLRKSLSSCEGADR